MTDEEHTTILENGTDAPGNIMTIEFQDSSILLDAGIIPFPLKKVEIEINDVVNLNLILNFYENLIREFWCKGKLKNA